MDIVINKSPDVNIHVSRSAPIVKIGASQSINMQMTHQVVNIRPHRPASPVFQFVQRVVRGSNVVRCTLAEFQAMESYDGQTWYAVTTTTDELRYLYLGGSLIAQASQDGGTWGFAYTFPMSFGR